MCGFVLGIPSIGIAKTKLTGQERPYRPDVDRLVGKRNETIGFVAHDPKTYWSQGFSTTVRQLESLIKRYSAICLYSIAASHHRASIIIRDKPEHKLVQRDIEVLEDRRAKKIWGLHASETS
jgi:deoxyinosine 3'endonuclease (endonuclease V)